MRFGHIPYNLLDNLDCNLPEDPTFNQAVITGKKAEHPTLYIGCGRWEHPGDYVQQFNCIEFNATLYRIYPRQKFEEWAAIAGDNDFKFCPKLPASVIDYLQGKGNNETSAFVEGVEGLGAHRGICFLQLGEGTTTAIMQNLLHYVQQFPTGMDLFIEFRHPSWFKKDVMPQLFTALQQYETGVVITDTAGRRDVLHTWLTVPKIFIRFVGNKLHPTDYTRLDNWSQRLQYWLDNGLQQAYCIMHGEEFSPELATYLQQKIKNHP